MTEREGGELERRLESWLAGIGLGAAEIERLAGDVSSRIYFRLRAAGGARRIVAFYPAELRGAQRRFAAAAALLEVSGVRVPRRFEQDFESGFALLEDLGERTLAERRDLDRPARESWIERGFEVGRRIAGLGSSAVLGLGSPCLDAALLEREIERTVEVLLAPRGLAPEPFVTALGSLCARLGAEPPVPCHRDFMARNLIPLEDGRLAVIDFQDLRLGPPAYDSASLLNDTFFAPEELERELLDRLIACGISAESYRRAVVQRTLKAVGTFVSFARRGDPRHLPLVTPSLERASRHLLVLPETAAAFAPLEEGFSALAAGDPLLD